VANDTPEQLVKYCTTDTAKKILQSQSLRWSAPHLFSDPFELTHEAQLGFDPHVLLQAAIKMATAMIFGKEPPQGNTPLINAIRRWREEERFASPDEAEEVMKDLLSQVVDGRQKVIEHMMTEWRKYVRTMRVASFSAKPDNLSAWKQFSANHSGVAIRFEAGENTSLPKPQKVAYKAIRPEISTLKEEMGVIMKGGQYVAQEHFLEKFTCKPLTCTDEQEWRCFYHSQDALGEESKPESEWFEDRRFERSDVNAIYFGVSTPTAEKRAIFDLIKEKYGQAKIFQSKTIPGKYELEFERITKALR
jgi:hypothetical protein